MGTTVIGGMLAASVIGIFLIPAIFYLVEKLSGAAASRRAGSLPAAAIAGAGRLSMRCAESLPLVLLAALS